MVKNFIKYYRPHLKLFIIDMICAVAIAVIDLIFPIITDHVLKELIPSAQNNEDKVLKLIIGIGVILAVFYFVRFVLSYIIGYYGHLMGIRIETDMRRDLFKKFQELDYQYFDDKKTGALMTN